MESPSLFQFCSNDELHYICEYFLSCAEPSTPLGAADESTFKNLSPPSLLLPSPPQYSHSLLSSSPLNHSSTHDLTSPNALITSAGLAKRDWLSSLSQSSPSLCPSSSAPPRRTLSSLSSSFANPYSSSSPSSLSGHPPPLCTKDLRDHLNPHLSHLKNTKAQTMEASGKQCDGAGHQPQSMVQSSPLGANAYGVALRLSDVKAALQAKPFDSHLSNSANAASKSCPTLNLNSFRYANPRNSTTTNGVNQTMQPALITSCNFDTSAEIRNEWLQGSCTNGALITRPNAESKWHESKKSTVINQATMLSGVMQDRRRQIHISTDRERRRGMKGLYHTLHSLLPDAKIKEERGTVLLGTMEYIKSLVKELDELKKKKVEVIALMKESKRNSNTTKTNDRSFNFAKASLGEVNSNTLLTSCGSKERNEVQATIKESTSEEDLKWSPKAKARKNKVEVSQYIGSENVKLHINLSDDENHMDENLANGGEKIVLMNGDKRGVESG